jgi:hypothetical protein
MQRAPVSMESDPGNEWDWLAVMQHYGLATRLLDWSESALVGLYFAVRDKKYDVKQEDASNACVWVFDPWWLTSLMHRGKELDPRSIDVRIDIVRPAKEKWAEAYSPFNTQNDQNCVPLPILLDWKTKRIAAQRGAFTVHPVPEGFEKHLPALAGDPSRVRLKKIIIKGGRIAKIRKELSVAGILETTVFPELGALSKEIEDQYFPNLEKPSTPKKKMNSGKAST